MTKNQFVIIANPRTGSNHFICLLNNHPLIHCHNEVFHRNAVYLHGENKEHLIEQRNKEPLKFLNQMYEQTESECVGFKIFDNHNEVVLTHLINNKKIKKIVLYRPNFLAVYSSQKIAESSGNYISMSNDFDKTNKSLFKSQNESMIDFDPDDFTKKYQKYNSFYGHIIKELNNSSQNYLYTTYEEYLNQNLFKRVFSFLGYEFNRDLQSRFKKQNSSNILSRFKNQEAVKEYLNAINQMNWCYEGFQMIES